MSKIRDRIKTAEIALLNAISDKVAAAKLLSAGTISEQHYQDVVSVVDGLENELTKLYGILPITD